MPRLDPKTSTYMQWPKFPPPLTKEQERAREAYMKLWHEELPGKYGVVEAFNHGFAAKLPLPKNCTTLEIGAGLGEHARYEDLNAQEYHFLEYREEFCKELRRHYPASHVHHGNIQEKQPWPEGKFKRVVAIHVLEHLTHLPLAVEEVKRLLTQDGVFDVVIPCEGGLAHRMGRKVTAERMFKKNFKMDFAPICRNEHVNQYTEIFAVLSQHFQIAKTGFFPLKVPLYWMNFCAGFRLVKPTGMA